VLARANLHEAYFRITSNEAYLKVKSNPQADGKYMNWESAIETKIMELFDRFPPPYTH
jgi:hypothetical protein